MGSLPGSSALTAPARHGLTEMKASAVTTRPSVQRSANIARRRRSECALRAVGNCPLELALPGVKRQLHSRIIATRPLTGALSRPGCGSMTPNAWWVTIVSVAVAAGAAAGAERSARMYLALGRQAENIATVRAAKGALTGAYLCCNLAEMQDDGSVTSRKNATEVAAETEAIRAALADVTRRSDPEVWHVVGVSQQAIESRSWGRSGAPAKFAELAASWHSTGLIVDYEPSTNYSQAHADAYGHFLAALDGSLRNASASRAVGSARREMRAGMDFAGWGILDQPYWHAYAAASLGRYTSMSPTYSGADVSGDEAFAKSALSGPLPAHSVAFGLGTELDTKCPTPKWEYHWTEAPLRKFLADLASKGALGVDLWRADIDGYCSEGTAPWMLDAVRDFVTGRLG